MLLTGSHAEAPGGGKNNKFLAILTVIVKNHLSGPSLQTKTSNMSAFPLLSQRKCTAVFALQRPSTRAI
jgi:hypothetical protein